jgi:hypothetical protein
VEEEVVMAGPKIGEVIDGYSYNGGDPNSKAGWTWVGNGQAGVDFAPKAAPKAAGGLAKTDQDALKDYRDQAATSLRTAQQAERFIGLNREKGTGGIISLPLVSDIAAAVNPTYGEMNSITSKVAPGLRPPGSGSSSDKDTKMYRSAFPNLDLPGEANASIADDWHKESDQAAAKAAFFDTWASKRGNLLGADQAFNAFWAKRQSGDPVANNVQPKTRLPTLPGKLPQKAKVYTWNPKTGELE